MARILQRPLNRITVSNNNGLVFYDAKYSCRELGLFLKQPLENLRPFVDYYPAPFLRGLFSADGRVGVSICGRNFGIDVVLGNSNRNLLQMTEGVLRSHFQIHSKTYLSQRKGKTWKLGKKTVVLRKDAYLLRVQRINHVRTFATKVGFQIARKQEMLDTALELVRRVGRSTAAKVWGEHYVKVGSRWRKRGKPLNGLSFQESRPS